MADVSIANTTAGVQNKTLVTLDAAETITGLKAFSRGANPPFSVNAGATAVANLDADKVDGLEASVFARWDGGGTPLGQIAFPATQNPSSDANTFDDYEEGSWTPVIGGTGGTSGQAYTTQIGRYVKKAGEATVWFTVTLSTEGTITGSVEIQGIPASLISLNVAGVSAIATIQWASLATNWVNIIGVVANNATTILIRGAAAAGATNSTALTAADINNTTSFVGTVTYRTAN